MPSRSRSTMSAKSCPEEKTGPAAASTTARASPASPIVRSARMSSVMCASDSAFRRSGRFIVTMARPASSPTRMYS